MTFRLLALTPTIDAAPGEIVSGRVEIHNDGTSAAVYAIEIVGLAGTAGGPGLPAIRVPVDAGQSAVVDVPIQVPATLGIGQHAAAFEAASSVAGERAVLTPFTLSIASVSRVELVAVPSTIRARRRAEFHLDVTNNEPGPVDVTLTGEAPDVAVQFTPAAATLQPGQRVVAKGKVRGRRHWAGEPTQHTIVITARGRASSTATTAAYVQRPLFAHRMRMVLAAMTVIALWLGAIGGVAFWLATRDDGSDAAGVQLTAIDTDGDGIVDAFFDAQGRPVTAIDTDGDGIPDMFIDADGNTITGLDTDGDGIPDALVDADGNPIVAVDTDGDGIPDALTNGSIPARDGPTEVSEPASTILRGTVKVDGDPTQVAITLTPITLGATPSPAATPIGFRGTEPAQPEGKLWSIRHGVLNTDVRRTVAIAPASGQPNKDGVWLFTDVQQGQSYELSFAMAGYDTRSFVVTPAADGQPIDLDVELEPSRGRLAGRVTGSGRPLGGADITITDGTLEFKTTSDSATGEWSIDGVSTPGVYTMTAVLRGYATAVRQVQLGPGESSTGIELAMAAGLGTITGRVVDSRGVPLRGVTLTASTGETTLTSTSLTEGDIGFYSLPQVAIPATYTVKAELAGYVTQTRRVPLDGSVGGVDFTMTSETVTLTGRVTSEAGGGIESAGLVISTGDLQFRSSTSAAPNAGVFSIDRLPPGTYTITVEHYQHESVTEFVTLQAGVAPPPLNVTLPVSSGPPDVGRGTLVVEVVNDDPTIDPPGIVGATITVSRNRTTDPPRVIADTVSPAVTFDNLPIGTYTVRVSAPSYNDSLPITRSVGLSPQRVEVELQKLGSASGRVVNAIDGLPINQPGMTLRIFRQLPGGEESELPPISVQTSGQWTTPAAQLPTGIYRLQVVQGSLPAGFLARNNQVLDSSPLVAGRPMMFVIPEVTNAAVEPVNLPDLKLDRYPSITGRVYRPELVSGSITFPDLDDAFDVTATCNGNAIDPAAITRSSLGGNPADDTFTISPAGVAAAIPAAQLPGSCNIQVGAAGRVPTPITIVNVDASRGATSATLSTPSDRLVATALARTPTPLTGTMFWVDRGGGTSESIPLDGSISTSPVVTRFTPTEATTVNPTPTPGWEDDPLTATVTGGTWSIDGHVFGAATYSFSAPNFGTGQLSVEVNQSTRLVDTANATQATVTPVADAYAVELSSPATGSIIGTVSIESITREYPTNMVSATTTSPGVGNLQTTPNPLTGAFTMSPAVAGTWDVSFATPPNHVRQAPPDVPVRVRVDPAETEVVDASFVELGVVELRLVDSTTPSTRLTPRISLTLDGHGSPSLVEADAVDLDPGPGVDMGYRLSGVPVAATNPATNPLALTARLTIPNFDVADATLNGTPGVDVSSIDFTIRAGETRAYTIGLAAYGTVSGQLVGTAEDGNPEQLSFVAATNPATMTITQVLNAAGDELPPEQHAHAPSFTGNADGTYELTGAPGFYRLQPAHPQYQDSDGIVVQIENNESTVAPTMTLTLRTSALSLAAVTQLTGGTPVDDAVYTLVKKTTPDCTRPTPGAPLPSSALVVAPGQYCLTFSKYEDGTFVDAAFPAIVVVTIPRSTVASPQLVEVVAPLPSLYPTLVGRMVARNTLVPANDVDLVSSTPPVVTLDFQAPNIAVDDGSTPNLAPSSIGATVTKSGLVWNYQLDNVPFGNNTITFPEISGYTPTALAQRQVSGIVPADWGPTNVPDFVYTQANVAIEFDLGSGSFPSLDPALPDNGVASNLKLFVTGTGVGGVPEISYTVHTFNTTTNRLRFASVPPDARGFTLSFSDALHATVSQPFAMSAISASIAASTPLQPTITATRVRLTGTTELRTSATTTAALDAGSRMTLAGSSTFILEPDPVTPPNQSSPGTSLSGTQYIMDVPAGAYTLTVQRPGYEPNVSTPSIGTNGTIVTHNVQILKLATARVAVSMTHTTLVAPTGLTYQLRDSAVPPITYSPSGGQTNRFEVPAGTYRAVVSGPTGYGPFVSEASTTLGIGQGDATTPMDVGITLPRVVRVTGPVGATVTVGGISRTQTTADPLVFSDRDPNTSMRIASSGALNVAVARTGDRTRTFTVAATTAFQDISTSLLPLVTVSGTVSGLPAGATLTASATGQSSVNATFTPTSGTPTGYSFAGLGVGTWTVSYSQAGIGHLPTAVALVTVTDDSHPTGVVNPGPAINVVSRPVDFVFTLTRTNPSAPPPTLPVGSAAIAILNSTSTTLASGTSSAAGTATLTVQENSAPASWSITHTDYLTRTGTISAITSLADRLVNVTMIPAVTGGVSDAGSPVSAATVTICPNVTPAPTEPCASPIATAPMPAAQFKITANLAPGTYIVWAVSGAKRGSTTLTVTSSAATLAVGTIPIA